MSKWYYRVSRCGHCGMLLTGKLLDEETCLYCARPLRPVEPLERFGPQSQGIRVKEPRLTHARRDYRNNRWRK